MALTREHEEEIGNAAPPRTPFPSGHVRDVLLPPPPASTEPSFSLPTFEQILAVFAALGAATGQRICLILALVAGFALTWRVVDTPDPAPNTIWALAIFCVVVAFTTITLGSRRAA